MGTCDDRFVRWRHDGTGDRLLAHAQTMAEVDRTIVRLVCVEGTIVRAHQRATGVRQRRSRAAIARDSWPPADEAFGRSRGGFTTKLHIAFDGRGRPRGIRERSTVPDVENVVLAPS